MKILISPAKKMRSDPDTLAPEALPALLPETERLLAALRAMTPGELQALWRCSDAIAAQNLERLRDMDLRRRLTPALLSYVGLQYQYMAPASWSSASTTTSRPICASCPAFMVCFAPSTG